MQLLHDIPQLTAVPGPVFLAIGVFDGVHLGHQAVIRRACDDAAAAGGTAVVVTFDPHPLRVLRPEQAPRLLTSTTHKVRLLRALGVEHLLVLPFTAEFAATPPDLFIRALAAHCQPLREICVGHAWSFGRGRAGNLQLLDTLGEELGFEEVGVTAVEVDGEIVSSTAVRQAIERGDLAWAARRLGRPYTILGTVQQGAQLGRKLGYPTANLSAHSEQFPPDGVYVVRAETGGKTFGGVANIGTRPTVSHAEGERLFEVHLFDYAGNLYGQDLEVTLLAHLRGEQRFDGLPALQAQIAKDAAAARAYLATAPQ